MGDATFQCDVCGRRFAWKPKLAGKKARCKCGETVLVPEVSPQDDQAYGLADEAPPPTTPPPQTTGAARCRSCNTALSPGAVVCVRCGTNQQTGQRLATDTTKPALMAADAPTDKPSTTMGLALVEVALWGHLLGLAALMVAFIAALVVAFSPHPAALILAGAGAIVGSLLMILGTFLLLFVPGEASARGLLIGAILLFLASIGVDVAGGMTELPWYVSALGGVADWVGTVLFLMFLKQLAEYFEFPEVVENADKLVVYFIVLSIGQFIFFLPAFLLIVATLYLFMAIYTFWLYVGLLIDLMRSARYRRQNG